MRFALIDAEQGLAEPVATVAEMCRTLEVSSSGYYAWKSRGPSQHQRDDDALAVKVLEVHAKSRQTYGRPRIHDKLKKQASAGPLQPPAAAPHQFSRNSNQILAFCESASAVADQ